VFAAESAYDVAAHAEVAMLASGTLTAAEQASMRHYDEQVYATLIPLRAAAESGTGVIPQAELDAAQAALSALSAFVAAHQGK
jgi:hypothetical protein